MTKKSIAALIGLLLLTSLTAFAQNAPSLPVLPQSQGLLTENDFGEPDITVDSTLDAVDANPGDGFYADAAEHIHANADLVATDANA